MPLFIVHEEDRDPKRGRAWGATYLIAAENFDDATAKLATHHREMT